MESYLCPSSEDIQLSTSPRRSPQITEGLKSPARSFHPRIQQMDSMHTEPDYCLRTTDFFDDTSDDDSAKAVSTQDIAPDNDSFAHQEIASKKRHSALPDEPFVSKCDPKGSSPSKKGQEGYEPLRGSATREDDNGVGETPSSSSVGSVDELLPGEGASSPPQFPQRSRGPSARAGRHSSNLGSAGDRTSRIDQTLGAYAIAHDITLQALMRDENALDRGLQSFPLAQFNSGDRRSFLPPSLHQQAEPLKVPQSRRFSSPPEMKKVHVVPPPIDTSAPRRSLPQDIVRTPYPFSPEPAHQKDNAQEKHVTYSMKSPAAVESILTLSIRQSNPNSKRRVTTLAIPASNDFSVVRSPRSKEQHFKAIDFDDEALFRQIRKSYHRLMGPMRFLSARSLRRICVSGSAMQEVDRGYWLQPLRSPPKGPQKSMSGTFSEERVMQYYRKPSLGKSRYAFVHWAHRLAASSSVRTPRPDEDRAGSFGGSIVWREEQSEGLEFLVCWSLARIIIASVFVLVISTAAALLWIFLGKVTVAGSSEPGGFRDAGDRVTSGVVMGICLLLFGLSSVAGWLGVSWLVM